MSLHNSSAPLTPVENRVYHNWTFCRHTTTATAPPRRYNVRLFSVRVFSEYLEGPDGSPLVNTQPFRVCGVCVGGGMCVGGWGVCVGCVCVCVGGVWGGGVCVVCVWGGGGVQCVVIENVLHRK